ncbi:MAG: 50S ribosomal protein L11 methyltransferase [Oscillospiraceae bacterium]|jgi:ribosomal protein L11 methyltransferase|nr:50S ribosomal protein L11 methyltransferase [Oscillospiraceae bacterium]MDY4190971.1 50S ribosomal protein L11 methyltransferase [Oscillospiraceae bacterium]
MNWTELSVYTTTAGIDPVAGILLTAGLSGYVVEDANDFNEFLENTTVHWDYVEESLMRLKDCETCVKGYLPENAQGAEMLREIRASIARLRKEDTAGAFGRLEILCGNLREEDWENNWKQYYKPTRVGERLVVVPSWEEYAPAPEDVVLTLDPGMAFGTGTHDTTRLCLALLEQAVKPGCTVLDVGCGSGILAVASLLLGASSAVGVDIDELAVKIAGENAALNGVEEKVSFLCGDLTDKVSGSYDVICANIVADVIKRLAPDIPRFLKPDGVFLASGIIDERADEVASAIEAAGLSIAEKKISGGWAALLCRPAR